MSYIKPVLLLTLCILSWQTGWSQEQHADYVVIGKSINHRLSPQGEFTLLNTVFFAEIFATPDGMVTNGILTGPGEAEKGLRFPEGRIQFLAGTRQFTIAELTRNFPDTTYYFNFDTPDGNVRNLPASFPSDAGNLRNPGPIRLSLFQDGAVADPLSIDPERDLTVRWSPFEKGAADPRGIAEDMIYVITGDCHGNEIDHSGHAISDAHALTYEAHEYTIPADKLLAGKVYQLEVEHSNMDTDVQRNIEVIVTYAATTFLDIQTTGDETDGPYCPEMPYAMDGGQTDRPRAE